MPEELECYRAAHDAESQRRYELKERALRVTNRNQPS
jgi:hypothetical protein